VATTFKYMANPPKRVRKAVLPAAGLGTRFLPATKAQPKEMLPVVDKPLIQYVVEECVASGIDNIIVVTGRGKNAIEDHFDSSPELEGFLEEKGKSDLAKLVRDIGNMVHFSYTRQKEPLGLGHAVLVAKELVGNEPFAVLLGDVIIPGLNPATTQTDGPGANKRILKIRDLVEKPSPAEAPSTLAVTGRYVLPPEIFDCLERTKPGRGGEIQLTDALRLLAQEIGLLAYVYEGKSYDAGDKLGFLKATVEIGLENQEFGKDFREYLRRLKL
jgi:UTP--glucose-1-phosphate uridylyltransferase